MLYSDSKGADMLYHMRDTANAIKAAGGCLLFVACLAVCWILLRLELAKLEPSEPASVEEQECGDQKTCND